MNRLRGRALVTVAATAAMVTGSASAHAGELQEHEPVQVFARAVAPDRAVVAVDAGVHHLRTAEVLDSTGTSIGRASIGPTGKALIPITVKSNSRKDVQVVLSVKRGTSGIGAVKPLVLSTEKTSLQNSPWRVVNKRTPLGAKDQPKNQVSVQGVPMAASAAGALKTLLALAASHDVEIYPSNGFRSYGWQKGLYQSYVRKDGAKDADRYSARPGYSEHQTGLAFDAKAKNGRCDLEQCFGSTGEGKFLAKHAREAGFLVRYTSANRSMTGYQPEPWHLRYVGTWLTTYLHETGTTSLEKAFGLPHAASYPR